MEIVWVPRWNDATAVLYELFTIIEYNTDGFKMSGTYRDKSSGYVR